MLPARRVQAARDPGTGPARADDRAQCPQAAGRQTARIQLGADDYVTKPFDVQELIARIQRC